MSLFSHMQKAGFLTTRLICTITDVNVCDNWEFSDEKISHRSYFCSIYKLLGIMDNSDLG